MVGLEEYGEMEEIVVRMGNDCGNSVGGIFLDGELFMLYSWTNESKHREEFLERTYERLKSRYGGRWKSIGNAVIGTITANRETLEKYLLQEYQRHDRPNKSRNNDPPHNPVCRGVCP
ncbi:MAG: hypothetical protein PHI12_11220 [Dehalococcoidales bacterium]|nr:hypothetical protein [Dehalococcoidales bacterium]